MNTRIRRALFITLILALASLSLFATDMQLSAIDLSKVSIYDQEGKKIDPKANSITSILDGFSFQTNESDLTIYSPSASFELMNNTIVKVIRTDYNNPEVLLLKGALTVTTTNCQSPIMINTPTSMSMILSNCVAQFISTEEEEIAFANQGSFICFNKVNYKRTQVSEGNTLDLTTLDAIVVPSTVESFRELSIDQTAKYVLDLYSIPVQIVSYNGNASISYPSAVTGAEVDAFLLYCSNENLLTQYGITISGIEEGKVLLTHPINMTYTDLSRAIVDAFGDYYQQILSTNSNFSSFIYGSPISGVLQTGKAELKVETPYLENALEDFVDFVSTKTSLYSFEIVDDKLIVTYDPLTKLSQVESFLIDTLAVFNSSDVNQKMANASQISTKLSAPLYVEGSNYLLSMFNGKGLVIFPISTADSVIQTAIKDTFASDVSTLVLSQGKVVFNYENTEDEASILEALAKTLDAVVVPTNKAMMKHEQEVLSLASENFIHALKESYQKNIDEEKSMLVLWDISDESLESLSKAFTDYKNGQISKAAVKTLIASESVLGIQENFVRLQAVYGENSFTLNFKTEEEDNVYQFSLQGTPIEVNILENAISFDVKTLLDVDIIKHAIELLNSKSMGTFTARMEGSTVTIDYIPQAFEGVNQVIAAIQKGFEYYLNASFIIGAANLKVVGFVTSNQIIISYPSNVDKATLSRIASNISKDTTIFASEGYTTLNDMFIFDAVANLPVQKTAQKLQTLLAAETIKFNPPAPAIIVEEIAEPEISPEVEEIVVELEAPEPSEKVTEEVALVSKPEVEEDKFGVKAILGVEPSYSDSYKDLKIRAFAGLYLGKKNVGVTLSLFDNVVFPFNTQAIIDYYKPTKGMRNLALYADKFVLDAKYKSPKVTLYYGAGEEYKVGDTSYDLSLKGFGMSSKNLYMGYVSNYFDFQMRVESLRDFVVSDTDANFALTIRPFKKNQFKFIVGAYSNLDSINKSVELYPYASLNIPLTRKGVNLDLVTTAMLDNLLKLNASTILKSYMAEAKVAFSTANQVFGMELGAAYNKGRKFTGSINDTQIRDLGWPVEDRGGDLDGDARILSDSLDIFGKVNLSVAKVLKFELLYDRPLNPKTGKNIDRNNSTANADVLTSSFALQLKNFELKLEYSALSVSSYILQIFNKSVSIKQGILNLIYPDHAYLNLGVSANIIDTFKLTANLYLDMTSAYSSVRPAGKIAFSVSL